TVMKFEKNHVIEIFTTSDWTPSGSEIMDCNTPSANFEEFFNKGRTSVGDSKYFIYDSKNANCQVFLLDTLKANNIATPEIQRWILQDAIAIYKGLGLLERANKAITDIASKIDHKFYGAGKKKIIV